VRIHAHDDRDGSAESGDLRQREIDEDHAALDNVHTEIRVDASQDQAGHERSNEKRKNLH